MGGWPTSPRRITKPACVRTRPETTGGAPLLAFEKWPAQPSTSLAYHAAGLRILIFSTFHSMKSTIASGMEGRFSKARSGAPPVSYSFTSRDRAIFWGRSWLPASTRNDLTHRFRAPPLRSGFDLFHHKSSVCAITDIHRAKRDNDDQLGEAQACARLQRRPMESSRIPFWEAL